jgi:hypothetical protein
MLNSYEIQQRHGLTRKQARFVAYYIENNGNGTKSAREAGYKNPHDVACKNLKNPKIQAALRDTHDAIEESSIVDRQELLEMYSSVARDTQARTQDRLKAMDSLARVMGAFIDKTMIAAQLSVEHLDRLTDQELIDKLVEGIASLEDAGFALPLTKLLPQKTE